MLVAPSAAKVMILVTGDRTHFRRRPGRKLADGLRLLTLSDCLARLIEGER